MNMIPFSSKDFNLQDPFVKEILKTGINVSGSDLTYYP